MRLFNSKFADTCIQQCCNGVSLSFNRWKSLNRLRMEKEKSLAGASRLVFFFVHTLVLVLVTVPVYLTIHQCHSVWPSLRGKMQLVLAVATATAGEEAGSCDSQ